MKMDFSDHAKENMLKRKIDETEVEMGIKYPDRRLFTVRNRRIVFKSINDKSIYTIEEATIVIVTVMLNV